MNIEGNKIIWERGNVAVTDTIRGYVVYKHITTENGDGTAFRQWVNIEIFDDEESAIEYAEKEGMK